jgi:arylformamidase
MTDYRAEFDAEVTFLNGGGLQAQGFRLDIPGPDVSEPELAAAFVRQLGLLMTDRVRFSAVRILQEPHKGLRGRPEPATTGGRGRMVELSHVVTAGMVTYLGLPGPEMTRHLTREASRAHYAPGTEFEIGRISMVGNTGTYLDSPYHRYPEGADLAGLPLDALADLPAVVVRVTGSGSRGIGAGALAALDVTGCAVLLHTGWDRFFGTPTYSDPAPYLTAEGASWLVDHGARLVGIDSINIDDPVEGGERPAHSTLLAAGIPVVEHLSGLEQLPPTGARFTAVPPPIAGFTSFPVRAFAVVPQ